MKNKLTAILWMALSVALLDSTFAQDTPLPPVKKDLPPRGNDPLLMQKLLTPQPEIFELTPEMEKEALAYLAQRDPRALDEFNKIKGINPRIYNERLRQIWKERQRLEDLQKDDPVRYERELKIRDLERQSRELSEGYRKGQDEAARRAMRANLSNVIAQLFDLREINRQDEVKRLEAELRRLKETLDQRQKNRAGIIERRIQQLTGEAGAMEWE